MRLAYVLLAMALTTSLACHPGPIVDTGSKPPVVRGTIAGIVSTEANEPVAGRRVSAIDAVSGRRYDAITGTNGGYTIQVPQGTYRLEVQLRERERVVKQPAETKVDKADLDPHRDFVIGAGG
jgi:hypothetical protein